MKFKIAVEMELDLNEKDTEMIETNPVKFCKESAKFCEEFAKTLASYATEDMTWLGTKCVYVDHTWMCDCLCENDQVYNNGILNGLLD